jgi:hypothetical protein
MSFAHSTTHVAVVTGASGGIGEVFADALAKRGYDLLLVARNAEALETVAARARAAGVRAKAVAADLSDPASIGVIADAAIRFGGPVELLVNNAGFGLHGTFETLDATRMSEMIRLNVESLMSMTRCFAPAMLASGCGAIVNVASTAAFQPVPFMAVYGATKAFVLSFSEAIAEEFRGRGVRVLALCPGPTETNFSKVAGESAATAFAKRRSSEQVVATALRALDAGKSVVIDGASNVALAMAPRFFPRGIVTRIAAKMMRPTG